MYKEKLRELLKEVPEVKEQMEKLEFGCKIIGEDEETIYRLDSEHIYKNNIIWSADGRIYDRFEYCKIIGLPLQERFIRMYCEKKNIGILFGINRIDVFDNNFHSVLDIKPIIIPLDNTKDLDNQSETFYKELYEALLELNKLG